MSMKRLLSGTTGIATVAFGTLFFIIPVALLSSVRPGALAIALAVLGCGFLLLSFSSLPRTDRARVAGKGILVTAIILAIVHISGLLEPLYRREGWLLLDVVTEVHPLQVAPGDTLNYKLSTTNTGARPAMARRFVVDGVPYRGMLIYGFLPTFDGDGFALVGTPTAQLLSEEDLQGAEGNVYTVVYANLQLPVLNSSNWDWSTTYTEGWDVIGVITSDGHTHSELAAGVTITLQYSVIVPPDHPAEKVRSASGSVSYRDPQWATHYIHERRFSFEETVTVSPTSN